MLRMIFGKDTDVCEEMIDRFSGGFLCAREKRILQADKTVQRAIVVGRFSDAICIEKKRIARLKICVANMERVERT